MQELSQDRAQYHKDKIHPTIGYSKRMVALEKKYMDIGMLRKLQAPYTVELNPKNPKIRKHKNLKFYNHLGVTGNNVQERTQKREEAEDNYFAQIQ